MVNLCVNELYKELKLKALKPEGTPDLLNRTEIKKVTITILQFFCQLGSQRSERTWLVS